MSEWKTYRLGDIIEIVSGFAYKGEYLGNGDKYLLGMGCVSFNEQFLEKGLRPYSGNCDKRYYAKDGDIVLATRQQSDNMPILGMPAIIPKKYKGKQMIVGANLYRVINKSKDFSNNFIYWLLKSPDYVNYIKSCQTGTTVRMITKANIENYTFICPGRETRLSISNFLWNLENKIELNRRINANLEAQAQALFRSWFVDFEPFRDGPFVDSELGKIPQGWKICRLKDATKEIIRGFTSKYVEKSDLINLNQKVNKGQYLDRQYYKFLNPEIAIPTNKFAQQNDILLNSLGQGTLGRVHYYGELTPNIVIDQHITIIRANNTTFQPSFIYLFLSSNKVQHFIEGMVTGSTGMQMLNISQVREMNIIQPDINTMNKFHNIVQPFFVEIRKNNSETEIIANIRDTLLPKLMAGEIRFFE